MKNRPKFGKKKNFGFRKTGIRRVISKYKKKMFTKKVSRVIFKKKELHYGDYSINVSNMPGWTTANIVSANNNCVDLYKVFLTNIT